jgi:hypothetical protein
MSEQEYLLDLWSKNICPNCGKVIAAGGRVGSGRKSEGGFCSLTCYTEFYKMELFDRAEQLAKLVDRHRLS